MPIFQPAGGHPTRGGALQEVLQPVGAAFAQAIQQRATSRREFENLLVSLDPQAATSLVNALDDRALRARGLDRERALGLIRQPTPGEQRAEQQGELQLTQQRQATQRGALDLGLLRQQVGQSLVGTADNNPLDPGRTEIQLKRLEQGLPLQNARFDDRIAQAAREAGLPVEEFLRQQSARFGAGTRTAQAQAAGAELGNVATTRGFGRFDDETGQVRELSPAETAQVARDPFSIEGIVVADELQQQVSAFAKFFGGDREKAEKIVAALAIELPEKQARAALLSSAANTQYTIMLKNRLAAEMVAGANPSLTPEQRRLAMADLQTAYEGSVGRVMGKLRAVRGLKIDPVTGQPRVGSIFLGFGTRELASDAIDVPENVTALTIEDISALVLIPPNEPAGDRNTMLARLNNLVADKLPSAVDVTDMRFEIDQGVDKLGNVIPARVYTLEEFLPELGRARVAGQRYRALATSLGFDVGGGVEGTDLRAPGGQVGGSFVPSQPPVLRPRGGVGGARGAAPGAAPTSAAGTGTPSAPAGALDTALGTFWGDQLEALRRRATPPVPQ